MDTRKLDHDEYTLGIVLPHIDEGAWVVDAGAFIGDHTAAYIKKAGPNGKVFAFEPNPAAYSCLCHNCPEAVTFNRGLSDREATVSYSPDQNAGAGHVEFDSGDIKLMTLDSLNLRRCDFLKIDIEGCEHEALIGARETIARCRPIMWIEVNEGALARRSNTPEELFRLIERQYDYKTTPYPPERGPQYDILCIP